MSIHVQSSQCVQHGLLTVEINRALVRAQYLRCSDDQSARHDRPNKSHERPRVRVGEMARLDNFRFANVVNDDVDSF